MPTFPISSLIAAAFHFQHSRFLHLSLWHSLPTFPISPPIATTFGCQHSQFLHLSLQHSTTNIPNFFTYRYSISLPTFPISPPFATAFHCQHSQFLNLLLKRPVTNNPNFFKYRYSVPLPTLQISPSITTACLAKCLRPIIVVTTFAIENHFWSTSRKLDYSTLCYHYHIRSQPFATTARVSRLRENTKRKISPAVGCFNYVGLCPPTKPDIDYAGDVRCTVRGHSSSLSILPFPSTVRLPHRAPSLIDVAGCFLSWPSDRTRFSWRHAPLPASRGIRRAVRADGA